MAKSSTTELDGVLARIAGEVSVGLGQGLNSTLQVRSFHYLHWSILK